MAAQERKCTVESVDMITPTTFELKFKVEPDCDFIPGQFISIIIPGAGPNGRDLRRAYSIASTPEERPFKLCIRLVENGPGTNYLHRLKPGETFRGFAPYGDFVYKPKADRHICFISTGTGVAPFRSMAFSKLYQEQPPRSGICLFGTTNTEELLYDEEWKSQSRVKWVVCMSRMGEEWKGYRGRVTQYMRDEMKDYDWQGAEYYLCGNGAMIDEAKKILLEKGVAPASIHQEVYYKPKAGE
ncbi:MAG: ferredoxin--NADP reductase [Bacteriovoracia bacterium]